MASIRKIGNSFHVQIRKKSKHMSASFSEKNMAEIWAKWNEDLIENMENFKVSPVDYITLEQCVEIKVKELIEKNSDKKTTQDCQNIVHEFSELKDIPFGKITTDMIRDLIKKKQNSIIRRGGNKNNLESGDPRKISPATILRKTRCLASVFSYMIEKGANINNPAQIVVNQLKMSIIKKGESIDE